MNKLKLKELDEYMPPNTYWRKPVVEYLKEKCQDDFFLFGTEFITEEEINKVPSKFVLADIYQELIGEHRNVFKAIGLSNPKHIYYLIELISLQVSIKYEEICELYCPGGNHPKIELDKKGKNRKVLHNFNKNETVVLFENPGSKFKYGVEIYDRTGTSIKPLTLYFKTKNDVLEHIGSGYYYHYERQYE